MLDYCDVTHRGSVVKATTDMRQMDEWALGSRAAVVVLLQSCCCSHAAVVVLL